MKDGYFKELKVTLYLFMLFYTKEDNPFLLPEKYSDFHRMNWYVKIIVNCFIKALLHTFLETTLDTLEVVVHKWNLDDFTICDLKRKIYKVMTDNLILLEYIDVNASVNTQYITNSGDVSVDKKNNDWENYELVETNKSERHTQYLSRINENIHSAGDPSHGLYNDSVGEKDSMYDKELLPVTKNSADSEYFSSENEFSQVKNAVYYSKSTEDEMNDNSRKYEFIKKDKPKHGTQYLNTAILDDSIYLGRNATHDFQNVSVSDKDNHLKDQQFPFLLGESVKHENDSQDIRCKHLVTISIFNDSICLDSNTTHDFQEVSDRDKNNLHLKDEEFFHLLNESVKSKNNSQDNLYTNSTPISTFNHVINLKATNTTHSFYKGSSPGKNSLHLKDVEIGNHIDESGKSEKRFQNNVCKNPICILRNEYDKIYLWVNKTTHNIHEDSDRNKINQQLEDEEFSFLHDEPGEVQNGSEKE